jgi:RecA/RadA recombinase
MSLSSLCSVRHEVVRSLGRCDIHNISDFLSLNAAEVCRSAGISDDDYRQVHLAISCEFGSMPIPASVALLHEEKMSVLFPTCDWLDCLLLGGLRTGEILEFAGNSGTGKTQLCMYLSSCIALHPFHPHETPLNSSSHPTRQQFGNVLFIDSTNTAVPSRFCDYLLPKLKEIFPNDYQSSDFTNTFAHDLPLSMRDTLERIRVVPIYFAQHLLRFLEALVSLLQTREDSFFSHIRLIVIDSLASIISSSFSLDLKRSSVLFEISQALKHIALNHGISIVTTNHFIRPSSESEEEKFTLGPLWKSVPNTRILLLKKSNHLFAATVKTSSKTLIGRQEFFTIMADGVFHAPNAG